MGCGIQKINFRPEWQSCPSFVHPTRHTSPRFWAFSMCGHSISRMVIFENISAGHLKSAPGLLLACTHVQWKVLKTLMKHGIPQLKQCRLNLGIMTSLALAWNGIVQMDSSDNVTLIRLPGSGIIWNKAWLPKSHMAPGQCAEFLKVRRWGIPPFDHSMTQESSLFTRSCWRTIMLMLCTV